MLKTLYRLSIERTYLKLLKDITGKSTSKTTLNGEKLKALPLQWGTTQGCPLSPLVM
jgi:hypothetical protein